MGDTFNTDLFIKTLDLMIPCLCLFLLTFNNAMAYTIKNVSIFVCCVIWNHYWHCLLCIDHPYLGLQRINFKSPYVAASESLQYIQDPCPLRDQTIRTTTDPTHNLDMVELAPIMHPGTGDMQKVARLIGVNHEYDRWGNHLMTLYGVAWNGLPASDNHWVALPTFKPNTPEMLENKYASDVESRRILFRKQTKAGRIF